MNSIHRIFKDGIAIERVDFIRATINEAQEIKDILLDDIDSKKIIVDLSMCDYIDSTFFGAMVFAHRVLRHQECEIALVISNTFLSKNFIYNEITSVFNVYHSMKDALHALNNIDKNTVGFRNENTAGERGPAKIDQMQLMLNPE